MQAAIQLQQTSPMDTYRGVNIEYRIANEHDNAVIASILQDTPMQSWVTLSMEFQPDYFAAQDLFAHRETIVAHTLSDSEAVGMCAYSVMPVFINGQPDEAAYLGELRVLKEFRNRLHVVKHGFKAVYHFSQQAMKKRNWFTSVAVDNDRARRLLEAGLKDMPVYQAQNNLLTLALPSRSGKTHPSLQAATKQDVDELADFYNKCCRRFDYAPVLSASWLLSLDGSNGLTLDDFYILRSEGNISACFALWDQRRIKQTVVRAYRFPLGLLRPFYNIYARMRGKVLLPPIGAQIDYVFLSFMAVDETMQARFDDIVRAALARVRQRGVALAMLGLAQDNPLLHELAAIPKQIYQTCIESVHWYDKTSGNDNAEQVRRLAQPEIAML